MIYVLQSRKGKSLLHCLPLYKFYVYCCSVVLVYYVTSLRINTAGFTLYIYVYHIRKRIFFYYYFFLSLCNTGVALISKALVIFQQCPLETLESLSGRDTRAISCIRSSTNIASSTYIGLMDHLQRSGSPHEVCHKKECSTLSVHQQKHSCI